MFISEARTRAAADEGAKIDIARKLHGRDMPCLSRSLWPALLPLLLLVIAFFCGGASAGQPIRDLIVELFAIVVLVASALGWIGRSWSPDARIPLLLIGGLAALFLFQLTPLPASLWSALGGREVGKTVLGLIGEPVGMRPLSVQPELTMLSALAVLPGVAIAAATMRLGTPARVVLAWGTVILAVLSLLLGAVQVSVGDNAAALTLYVTSHMGLPIGVFANTNHQADMLLVGFVLAGVLAPAMGAGRRLNRSWWVYGVMAALAAGVVATGSRTGIALLGVALLAVAMRERLAGNVRMFLLGVVGLATTLGLLIVFNPVFARSFGDFANLDDPRFHFWPNVMWAIGQFGWLGTGAGTFDGVYRSVETLDTLSSRYLNHAHNDYLEIFLEMGIPGLLLLVAFVAFLVFRGVEIIRRSDMRLGFNLAHGGMICAVLLLLHSAVDYPLRTPLLSVMFGLCCALMTRPPRLASESEKEPSVKSA